MTNTSVLVAASDAEWQRLLSRLAATGATEKKPGPFLSVKIASPKRTLTVTQAVPYSW